MNNLIELKNASKDYRRGAEVIHAVDKLSLTVREGEFIVITGPSGSGKTTLMQLMGCMDTPTEGHIYFDGQSITSLSDTALSKLRAKSIGFVFQQFFLVPTLTARENVELPKLFSTHSSVQENATRLLTVVGLDNRMDHYPHELSGGEMQRVAIARALINKPKLLLADEPTGNLDSQNAESVIKIFRELNQAGLTVVMVTHNPEFARNAGRVITMKDGQMNCKSD